MDSDRSGMAHCHTAVNLSSPESAYSTGEFIFKSYRKLYYNKRGTTQNNSYKPERTRNLDKRRLALAASFTSKVSQLNSCFCLLLFWVLTKFSFLKRRKG